MKARQSIKIKELKNALIESGYVTLDQQAKALGLARSTTWTILRATHKSSGLSAATINCMLRSPQLPPIVRTRILEYVEEKSAGLFGHGEIQRRRFLAGLSAPDVGGSQTNERDPSRAET
jgi:hypothetical protein